MLENETAVVLVLACPAFASPYMLLDAAKPQYVGTQRRRPTALLSLLPVDYTHS